MKTILRILLLSGCTISFSAAADSPEFAHIETSGYGEVITKPDMAEFRVRVVETALNADQAKQAADAAVESFMQRLTTAGVERDDIKATNLSLTPQYHYPKSGKSELVGYRASRQITVVINELEKLNTYLDGALGDGINRIDSIQLKVKDREEYQQQARLEAIKDAKSKAASLAEGFGGRLNGVWKVSYHNGNVQPVMMRAMAMDSKTESAAGYQDTAITISDSVNVVYRFEQE